LVLAALSIVLAGLDLARPYLDARPKPIQLALAILAMAVVGLWMRERGGGFRESVPFLALGAFLIPTYLGHSRALESDGIHYYTYLRSLLFDLDLDLHNDYALFGWNPDFHNPLPIGAPLLWSPFVVVVHLGRELGRLVGFEAPSGVEPVYQATACLATLLYGAAGLFLLFDTLRGWRAPIMQAPWTVAAAFWTVVICWVGSPLRFYLSVLPGLAHGVEFFAAVLVLRAYLRLRDRSDPRSAAWAGAACGLVFLARSQDGAFLLLPGLELASRLWRGPDRRRAAFALAALGAAFLLVALPQLAVWQAMYGVPILIPHKVIHGEAFMHLAEPQLAGTLLSPRGGLFVTHPAMLVALLGLIVLLLRDRRYVAAVLPVMILGWYVNSTVFDWYHVRRFTGLVPLLAPGLALVLAPLSRAGTLAMALLAFLVLRYDFAVDTLRGQPGEPVPVRAALQEMCDEVVGEAYRSLEPRAPRTAVVLLAAYTGEGVLTEDVTELDLVQPHPLFRVPSHGLHLSEVTSEDGVACRWVRGPSAHFTLPLADPGSLVVRIHARALETVEPQVMEAFWNETSLGRREMRPSWSDYQFDAPASSVHIGTNLLTFHFDRSPIYHRARDHGPREVRPAAFAWLRLYRRRD
jgi:hypothetical protein